MSQAEKIGLLIWVTQNQSMYLATQFSLSVAFGKNGFKWQETVFFLVKVVLNQKIHAISFSLLIKTVLYGGGCTRNPTPILNLSRRCFCVNLVIESVIIFKQK